MNKTQDNYLKNINSMQKEFKYKSIMQVPKIEKIILNMTAGKDVANEKAVADVKKELAIISGQIPFETRAKKSLASWKLREGMPMGAKVTLRNKSMWNFLHRLIHVVIPRIRDFRGLNPHAFDGHGNFSLGVKEEIIFPEINFDKIKRLKGLDIIIVTTAKTNKEARYLLKHLGMPFRDSKLKKEK